MSGKAWRFEIEGTPQTKGRARHDPRTGGVRTPDRTRSFEQRIAGAALEAGVRYLDGFVFEVKVGIYLPTRRPKDTDNVLKVVLDGLQRAGAACLPNDDVFHVPRVEVVLLGVDRAAPRLEVEILRREARGDEGGTKKRRSK